jgi:hypothetical protein
MEAASQSSHGSYNGDNIEAGLSAEQSKTHVPQVLPSQKKRKIVMVLVVLFVVLIITVILVLVSRNKPEEAIKPQVDNIFEPGDDPTEAPVIPAPQLSRLQILREMLIPVSGVEPLTDPTTPQYAALAWLADDDPAQVDLSDNAFKTISDRYKVSLLYFATSGSGWRMQHTFLTETSICEWNDGGEGGAFEGILCENGEVVEIILGAFPSEEGVVAFLKELTLFSYSSMSQT